MKRTKFFTLLLILFMTTCTSEKNFIETLENKPLPDFVPPKILTHTFSNGLKLYFLPNDQLPVFQVYAMLEVGGIDEDAKKLGLLSLMMGTLRTGGTTTLKSDDVDLKLEENAIQFGTDSNREFSSLSINSLIKDSDLALDLFFDHLIHPAFEESKLELNRQKQIENIKRRNEDPMDVAFREFRKKLYGDESIWARISTEETVKNASRADIIHFYNNFVAPNKTWLAVSGKISFEDLISKIESRIKGWPKKDVERKSLSIKMEKKWAPGLFIAPKDVNQSSIIIGHLGEKRTNPDKYALTLANDLLGGSIFSSRMGNKIRTKMGLAYSIYSSFGFETEYAPFYVMVATKSASTVQVLEEMKKIILDIQTSSPALESEMEASKNALLNQLIFQYQDPFKIVRDRVMYDYYGYPPDYLSIYQKEIKKVTLEDIQRVLKTYFFTDKMITLIVGNPDEVGDLSPIGVFQKVKVE